MKDMRTNQQKEYICMEDQQHEQVEAPALFPSGDDVPTEQATRESTTQQSPLLTPSTTQQSAVVAKTIVPAPTTTVVKPDPEDLYDLQRCTVCLSLQFYQPQQPGQPRRVVLSIQNGATNKADLPLLAITTEEELGALPPALLELWARLEADLPLRKQREEERAAKAAVVKSTAVVTSSSRKAAKVTTTQPVTPPPPPTTSSPIEKEGLGMRGLFDEPEE
jgi:hypothetical protein